MAARLERRFLEVAMTESIPLIPFPIHYHTDKKNGKICV